MIDTALTDRLPGTKVLDRDGDKVGTVDQVYVDDSTGSPLFVAVRTGLFGSSESFIPLENAQFDGDDLHVAYDRATIKDAPRTDNDGRIDEAEQDRLFDYYGLGTAGAVGQVPGSADDSTTAEGAPGALADTTEGRDTSGPTTDDAMTRSEERLHAGTEKVESGRAKLRKHIVTEQQTVTVPVTHDEVRIEREPITEANVGDATSGPELSEEEHEIVLTAERPLVTKETVAVERVRLGTEQVTEQQQVTEDVRHEEIEQVDADGTVRS